MTRATCAPPRAQLRARPRCTAQWYQPAGKGESFYTGTDGYQYVDNMRVDDVRAQVQASPFYLYSQRRITSNYMAYKKALEGIDSIIGYAVKANNNLLIMKHLQQLGSGAVLVSGNELKMAVAAGFDPTRCARRCTAPRGAAARAQAELRARLGAALDPVPPLVACA